MKTAYATLFSELSIPATLLTAKRMFVRTFGGNGAAAFGTACYLFPFLFSKNCYMAEATQPVVSFNFDAG